LGPLRPRAAPGEEVSGGGGPRFREEVTEQDALVAVCLVDACNHVRGAANPA
jgi:hypothetical protein